ncbi:hypothetical protein [Rhodococcus sp. NPDC006774]|uniref:hypothetical protein n=1 Tax=Rhodococcus sp. NPDC006774 TaxID=3157186 RepID=UPI0033F04DE6
MALANAEFTPQEVVSLLLDGHYPISEIIAPKVGGNRKRDASRQERAQFLIGNRNLNYVKAVAYVKENPAIRSRPEAVARIGEVIAHARQAHFRAGSCDLRIMEHLCAIATGLGSIKVSCAQSSIRLAINASPSSSAVPRALKRLIERGYLAIAANESAKGARTYTLRLPDSPPRSLEHSEDELDHITRVVRSRLHTLDAFLGPNGLGDSAAIVFWALAKSLSPVTEREVVAAEMISLSTVKRALNRLSHHGLVVAVERGWCLSSEIRNPENALDSVAIAIGSDGEGARRRAAVIEGRDERSRHQSDWAQSHFAAIRLCKTEADRRGIARPYWKPEVLGYAIEQLRETSTAASVVYDRAEAMRIVLDFVQDIFFETFENLSWREHVGSVAEHVASLGLGYETIDQIEHLIAKANQSLPADAETVHNSSRPRIFGRRSASASRACDQLAELLRLGVLFGEFADRADGFAMTDAAKAVTSALLAAPEAVRGGVLAHFSNWHREEEGPIVESAIKEWLPFSTETDLLVLKRLSGIADIEANPHIDRILSSLMVDEEEVDISGVLDASFRHMMNGMSRLNLTDESYLVSQIPILRKAQEISKSLPHQMTMLAYLIGLAIDVEYSVARLSTTSEDSAA